mmetsp:Transcript_11685/g.30238  ORF Transcript_11685/g.30238 Transcript_11685/m.30238 type:complete len:369 (-) Transcript_11685:349-1455(-)
MVSTTARRTLQMGSLAIRSTWGRRCCSVASAPRVSMTGASDPRALRRISTSSSPRKILRRGSSSDMVLSGPRVGARLAACSEIDSRTAWLTANTSWSAGAWGICDSSRSTGRMEPRRVWASRCAQKGAMLSETSVRTSSSASMARSRRKAWTWSRICLTGCIAWVRVTKCLALWMRMERDDSFWTLSMKAPNSLVASSAERPLTMATAFSTASSRTLSWRSLESSLKMGESSIMSTSFSITAAKAGRCAKAARRTIGISSLARSSYCLRSAGRWGWGVDGYTVAYRPAPEILEGKKSAEDRRLTMGANCSWIAGPLIVLPTITSASTALLRTTVSSCSHSVSSSGSRHAALSPPPHAPTIWPHALAIA